MTSRGKGYTLTESLMVLAVTSVLLALGVPQYRDFAASRRTSAEVAELAASFKLARTEALKRGVRVSVCRTDNGSSCSSDAAQRDWSRGWLVFVDRGMRGKVEPGDSLLRVQGPLAGSSGIVAAGTSLYVPSFLPTGSAVAAQNNFRFDGPDAGADTRALRRLCIGSTGSWRLTRGAAC
jgi:type IV fimbrial biogenesis protein FimT